MLVIVVLVVVAALAGAVAWVAVSGESWEDHGRPEPEEPIPPADEPEAAASAAALEPAPPPDESEASAPEERHAGPRGGLLGLRARRRERAAPAGRRVRFEDALDLTIPFGPPEGEPDAEGEPDGVSPIGYGPVPGEADEEHVPLATRVSGALRLLLLVAVAAGLVALALVGTGYLLSERVVSDLGR